MIKMFAVIAVLLALYAAPVVAQETVYHIQIVDEATLGDYVISSKVRNIWVNDNKVRGEMDSGIIAIVNEGTFYLMNQRAKTVSRGTTQDASFFWSWDPAARMTKRDVRLQDLGEGDTVAGVPTRKMNVIISYGTAHFPMSIIMDVAEDQPFANELFALMQQLKYGQMSYDMVKLHERMASEDLVVMHNEMRMLNQNDTAGRMTATIALVEKIEVPEDFFTIPEDEGYRINDVPAERPKMPQGGMSPPPVGGVPPGGRPQGGPQPQGAPQREMQGRE